MNKNMMIGMTKDGFIRFYVANTTEMVEKAREIHQTTPVATAALGRSITAASIMGKMEKNDNVKLTFQVRGSNLIKSIVAVSDSNGTVKGYISNPDIDILLKENGKLDVGGAVGKDGSLIIIKDLGLKEPYIGQANLVSGEIAEDVASYYMSSEQQPSVVSLGVFVDRDMKVEAAGGFIIQTMPGIDEDTIVKLENNLGKIKTASQMVRDGMSNLEIIEAVLEGFELEIMEESEIKYECDCTRERIEKALISVGVVELKKIIEEDEKAELSCHFCNKKYSFDKEELESLLSEITA
ncbi:MAG: Hsp33 family molecular chaperone HslO [Firmicutes bacterium]|jgi:molecular chaperone Hsp33|nr:Hsp33 family molecular chaperone HslO [Bacillota bacterium]